jgi:hypothetical protein
MRRCLDTSNAADPTHPQQVREIGPPLVFLTVTSGPRCRSVPQTAYRLRPRSFIGSEACRDATVSRRRDWYAIICRVLSTSRVAVCSSRVDRIPGAETATSVRIL